MSETVNEKKLPAMQNELGQVEIAPDVLEIVTGLAASEIEGVDHLRGSFASGVAERLGRKSTHSKGVKIDLDDEGVMLEIYLVATYGYSIPDIGKKVQENVIQTMEMMTGVKVKHVHIHVTGVQLEPKEPGDQDKQEKTVTT
ncbi:Asp23/Gls24 family envelope stress response protein [Alkalicoccus chagannorensis]|uniref:Asp23/Gls24 family envelope stress response protein n=1 Tax=Alkalicoccus chagannorensis TaxID=427072 RepID=UPI0003F6B6F7|nr:Asp23/Gls24 family envelope stress response protein [Alkalicoccus chagannorensis]